MMSEVSYKCSKKYMNGSSNGFGSSFYRTLNSESGDLARQTPKSNFRGGE